jgi:hypothetical protein
MLRLEMRAALDSFSRALRVANSIGKKRLSALASDLSAFGGGVSFDVLSFFFGRTGGPEVSVSAWRASFSPGGSETFSGVMESPSMSFYNPKRIVALQ